MSPLKEIIQEEVSKSFTKKKPNVYLNSGKGLENIDKESLFNIRKINELEQNSEILLAFYLKTFKPDTFWVAERTIYNCAIFLEDRMCIRNIEETTGWDKKPDYLMDFDWTEIEEAEAIFVEEKDSDDKIFKKFF